MLATVRTRARPFAQTTCLQRIRVGRANGSAPERTPSAAIAAIVILATFNSLGRRRRGAGRYQPEAGEGRAQAEAGRDASPRVLSQPTRHVRFASDRGGRGRRSGLAAARARGSGDHAPRLRARVREGAARGADEGSSRRCVWKRVGNERRRKAANAQERRDRDSAQPRRFGERCD